MGMGLNWWSTCQASKYKALSSNPVKKKKGEGGGGGEEKKKKVPVEASTSSATSVLSRTGQDRWSCLPLGPTEVPLALSH
jgi:hypothetical protein